MTVIIKVDCNKLKKIIGIILWIGLTIGLASCIYGLINNMSLEEHETCFKNEIELKDCYYDSGFAFFGLWILAIAVNGVNGFFILDTINSHNNWIRIECKSKENK